MRASLAPLLLAGALLAGEPSVADRLPAGATAYAEARGLGAKLDALLASPLAKRLAAHPAYEAFRASPQGRAFDFYEAFLKGATGHDLAGLFKAVAGDEIAVAVYGAPRRVLVVARMKPEEADRVVTAAELAFRSAREEVAPADDRGPALHRLGPVFFAQDGPMLLVTPDEELARRARARGDGFGQGEEVREARRLAGGAVDLFGFVDFDAYRARLRRAGKPRDVAQAMLFGAFPHYLPEAPWGAFGVRLDAAGETVRLTARGWAPRPADEPAPVRKALCGTLAPLPFALPENTLAVVRMRRDLESVWSHRDALIDPRGLADLVLFETNFGNLTGGMSWVEEFLPNLKGEACLVVARHEWGEKGPAVRYPEGAVLWPIRDSESLDLKLQVAFQTAVGVVNASQAQMRGSALLLAPEMHGGVLIQSARYLPPSEGEMEGRAALPPRYNFTPSAAIVGDHLVLASTADIVKALVDGRGGTTPAPAGVNAGLWLRPGEIAKVLAENRGPLVANNMMEKGHGRAAAEGEIDLLLEAAGYVRALSLTAEETESTLGLTLDLVVGPPEVR